MRRLRQAYSEEFILPVLATLQPVREHHPAVEAAIISAALKYLAASSIDETHA